MVELKDLGLSIGLENCFVAVNRSPNCVKWVGNRHFVCAAFRTLVVFRTRTSCSSLSYSTAIMTLNAHDHVISCLDIEENPGVTANYVVASGDKKGCIMLWHLTEDQHQINFVSSQKIPSVHRMSVNCIKLLSLQFEVLMFSTGDSTIRIHNISLFEKQLKSCNVGCIDLKNAVCLQLNSVLTNSSKIFLFCGFDDRRRHLYLCDDVNVGSDPVFDKVFISDAFDDWIRGISCLYLTPSNCNYVTNDVIYTAVSSQDSFIQIFTLYFSNVSIDGANALSDNEESLKKTQIRSSDGDSILCNIYAESILSGHTDKVFTFNILIFQYIDRVT